jgi:hypothetical protein
VSRNKWLIVVALALANVVVLGAMTVVVIRSLTRPAPAPASVPTPVASPQPPVTSPPTWTPTLSPTPQSTPTPSPTGTPTQTPTPWPTPTATLPPTPAAAPLENPTFEGVLENFIPGWQTGAFVNWAPGDEFDAATSYAAPRFHQADDPRQWIDGPTLQIDTVPWVKLRAWVFQTVNVGPGSRVQFRVCAVGFVKETAGGYILKVGVDPDGGEGCEAAQWGAEQIVNQNDGVVELISPKVVVGQAGQVTVCMFAETQFAQVYHAAFFDDAVLTVWPAARP